jgi:hypothetical protein
MFENPIKLNTSEERKAQREKLAKERSEENIINKKVREIKEKARMAIDPEGYIGVGDMALFRSAEYSKEEINWIARVKLASSKERAGDLNAYDLIRVHAMLAKDLEKYGSDMISDQTEEYLDEILLSIAMRYEEVGKLIEANGLEELNKHLNTIYEVQAVEYFNQYKNAKTAKDKAVVLTKWLNLVHHGGNREVLSLFGGYPVPDKSGLKEIQRSQQDFLSRLNDLGSG